MLLTTETLIADKREEQADAGHGGHGHAH